MQTVTCFYEKCQKELKPSDPRVRVIFEMPKDWRVDQEEFYCNEECMVLEHIQSMEIGKAMLEDHENEAYRR